MTRTKTRDQSGAILRRLSGLILLAMVTGSVAVVAWPAQARDAVAPLPWHLVDVYFDHHDRAPFQEIRTTIDIVGPVANKQYLYLCVLFGKIGDTAFYYGLQTDLGPDRGILFSRWGAGDQTNDIRAPANGIAMAVPNARSLGEGDLISVRTQYPWTSGSYEFTLSRRPATTGPGFWADLRLIDRSHGRVVDGGSLRFNEGAMAKPGSLVSFVELYGRPPGISFPDQYRPPPLSIEIGNPRLGDGQPLRWAMAHTGARIPHLAAVLWTGQGATVTLDTSQSVGDQSSQPLVPTERVLYQRTKPYCRRPSPSATRRRRVPRPQTRIRTRTRTRNGKPSAPGGYPR